MLKLISLVLSFSLIFSSVAPSYAAGISAERQEQMLRESIEAAISETAEEEVEESYESQVALIFEQINTLINPSPIHDPNIRGAQISSGKAQTSSDVLHFCAHELKSASEIFAQKGITGDNFLAQGSVCTIQNVDNNTQRMICSNALAFAQTCASVALDKRWDGKGKLRPASYTTATMDKNYKQALEEITAYAYQPLEENILGVSTFELKGSSYASPYRGSREIRGHDMELVKWLGNYGIINNYDKAMNYLTQILNIKDVCTKADKDGDVLLQRFSECSLALEAMDAMVVLAEFGTRYSKQAADEIYNFIKNKHRKDLGSVVVLRGAVGLMALNTDSSYLRLADFLTNHTRPTKGETALEVLGTFSLEGVADTIHGNTKNNAVYLNAYTRRFAYLDMDLIKAWYGEEAYNDWWAKQLNRTDKKADQWGTYQYPMGNLYEDLGAIIAKDGIFNQNRRSAALAKAIANDAKDTHFLGRYPQPLYAGVLFGGYGEAEGRAELNELLRTNFIDMNEGTQRRFHMNALKGMKTPSDMLAVESSAEAYDAFVAQYKKRDDVKYDQYARLLVDNKIAFIGDMFIITIFVARMIVAAAGAISRLGGISNAVTKGLKNLRQIGSRLTKSTQTALKGGKRLAYKTTKVSAATQTAGATAQTATTATKAAAATSQAGKAASTTAKAATSTSKAAGATADGAKAASEAAGTGRMGLLTIDSNGIPQIQSMVVQPAETIQNGLKGVRSTTAVVGEGGGGAIASSGRAATSMTYKHAARRIKQIQKDAEIFKGTSAEGKFNAAVKKYIGQAKAAKQAAKRGSSSLNLIERAQAYEEAFSEVMGDLGKSVEFVESNVIGGARIAPSTAATAFTLNNEMQAMQAATKAAGRTPRIYTDADIPWTLRARIAVENFLGEVKLSGQGVARAAANPQGRGALVALAGMINPAVTGDAIKAAQIFSDMSRPAIVMVADTEHIGTVSVRMLTASGLEMPTKPITMPVSKLPATLMSFEEAYKILTPVFINMGLRTYDEVFSEAAIAKAFETDTDAALAYYTFDKTAERELFNAYGSGNKVKYTAPTEMAAPAPATSVVKVEIKLPINVNNPAQVSQFATRVVKPFSATRVAAMDVTGGLASLVNKLATRKQADKYQGVISDYVSQAAQEAQRQVDADPSISANLAFLNGVEKVLSQDTALPKEIKEAFVEEVIKVVEEEEATTAKTTAETTPETEQTYASSPDKGTTRGEAFDEALDDVVEPKEGLEGTIQQAINEAKVEYQSLGVQNISMYASLLVSNIKQALTAAGVDLTAKGTINTLNTLLLGELGENHLLRQQAVDGITGRKLSPMGKIWRWMATKLTGKMVNLDTSDVDSLSKMILKALVEDNVTIDFDALRQAIKTGGTLVKTEKGSYLDKNKEGEVHQYDKETYDYSRVLAEFTPAALKFTSQSDQLGFRPRMIETDVKGFPYLYTSIKLKMVEKDAQGHTTLRKNIYTVVLSDDAKIFSSLKEGEMLVVDTYGNLYKTIMLPDGTEKRTPIFDRKVSVVRLADLDNMPVVILQKTHNRLKALNSVYQAMGLSSTGRFLNSFLSEQYGVSGGALAGAGNVSGVATGISTGVYFTNIAPLLGLHQAVEKFGGKKVLNVALSASIGLSLSVAAINALGGNPHGWITLAPIIGAIAASGLASAAIQQIANPTAQRMLGGKEAGYIVAGGQLQKTIGSLMTYAFASAAIILTGNWEFMYGLIAIPTLKALFAVNVAELPLPPAKVASKDAEKSVAESDIAASDKEGKIRPYKFLTDPKIITLFLGLFLFCGSETQASTATKSIITGLIKAVPAIGAFEEWLANALSFMPWVSAEGMDVVTATNLMNDSIATLISGAATMLPVLFGRSIAKELMRKYKNVDKYNEKMWLISGLGIAACLGSMYLLGPNAGLALLPIVVLANGLLGNMFTFTFNMMKNHDKQKYNNAFSTLAGSLSTIAVIGCFFIPLLAHHIFPEVAGVDKLITAFHQLIVPIVGVSVALLINFKNFANPFSWKMPMPQKQLDEVQASLAAQMAVLKEGADLSELEQSVADINPDLTQEEVHELVGQNINRLKTEVASALGVSVEELEGMLNGNSDKQIDEESLKKLAEELNIKFKALIKDESRVRNRLINQLMLQINAEAEELVEQHNHENYLGGTEFE